METELDNVKAEGVNMPKPSDKKESKKKNKTFPKVAAGVAGGIVLGTAGTVLVGKAINHNAETENETEAENLDYSAENATANETVEVAEVENVNDGMSFADAFAAAHDAGPGSYFEWNGQVYLAFTEDEWNNMTPEDQTNYSNLAIQDYNSHNHAAQQEPVYANTEVNEDIAPATPAQEGNQEEVVYNGDEIDYATEGQNNNNITAENTIEPEGAQFNGDEIDYTAEAGQSAPSSEEFNDDNIVAEQTADADGQSEIEVLGVYHDDEDNSNVGGLLVDNQEVYLIDVDNNQVFDYAAIDRNNDSEFQDDEIIDIQGENLTVNDLQQAAGQGAAPTDDLMASNSGDGMADYVNNADDVYEA